MKTSLLNKYKTICLLSILILATVQFFLVYNTYELKNEHYYLSERKLIIAEYGKSIRDDKLFPGGSAILDRYIYGHMQQLEQLYHTDSAAFGVLCNRLRTAIFSQLRKACNLDSIIGLTEKKYALRNRLAYALTIDNLEITFDGKKYVELYNKNTDPEANAATSEGVLIGGTLADITPQNRIVNLTVSNGIPHSYIITFNLHVDTYNRRWVILQQMMPTLALSLIAIVSVILLFYLTLRNWAKQKNIADMKSDFINSITHEFHTPLSAIIIANKNLQSGRLSGDQDKQRMLTEIIQRQSERLQNLFEQVLDITGMQNLQLHTTRQPLHLLLEEILLDYRLKLADSDVALHFSNEAENDTVPVDAFWLTTLLNNLFDNAIKYNANTPKEINVRLRDDKKKLQLLVEDNGIGIRHENQEHIFEKFYRGKGLSSHINGLGLGLYYVKLCVDAHHWHIGLESEPGKGSRFIITIPL
jgi:two-component system phosphate regulon sensor histidine kinase PhoR